jgi:hypothetical protein
MRINTKTVETVKLFIRVITRDIREGECGLPGKCMERVAIERALRDKDPKGGDHKTKIDAGIIKFNLKEHRWTAFAPKIAKRALIQFDKEEKARKKAEKLGLPFVSKVQPHQYWIEATKGDKIRPMTPERQEQINQARRRRIAEGRPDKPVYNLHKRVVGLAATV